MGVRGAIGAGARVERSVLLGADFYEHGEPPGDLPPLGVGRDVVLDRVIIDKNARIGDGARLVNEAERRACRRRRLLHPRRHHRRAEERRDQTRSRGLVTNGSLCDEAAKRSKSDTSRRIEPVDRRGKSANHMGGSRRDRRGKPPDRQGKPPDRRGKPPDRRGKPPLIVGGSPRIVRGSPLIVGGSPLIVRGSPRIVRGSPRIVVGKPPDRQGKRRCATTSTTIALRGSLRFAP